MGRINNEMFERRIGSDGMTVVEREIMRLSDEGAGIENIQFITGQTPARIRHVQGYLSVTAQELWKDDAVRGSAALIAALRLHHPSRCGAVA